jgi:type II restriction enzyme
MSTQNLTSSQEFWLNEIIKNYTTPCVSVLNVNTFLNQDILTSISDALKVHHTFSKEPCSKDRFEYMLEQVFLQAGKQATLAGKGNPGHDITIDGVKINLKTQANKHIKKDVIWISKFHELGKGDWGDDPKQLLGLREQFFEHMKNYERIFTMRCLSKSPNWKYQLVEIPKDLLMKAETGELVMMLDSKQMPKPGYCYVREGKDDLFQLYFDGGSERKLQITNLLMSRCVVHATWEFSIG